MNTLKVNVEHVLNHLSKEDLQRMLPDVVAAREHLLKGDAAGNDFLGWVNLPEEIDADMLAR